uniref:AMSH-like protease n=2 Tax=Lygus hesperus TaxID=30085 RepID=A0A0A9XE60_LYGHE
MVSNIPGLMRDTTMSSNGLSEWSVKVAKRKKRVNITMADDIVILQEVISLNPFGSPERWRAVTENVMALIPKTFTVKNIRGRVRMILEQFENCTVVARPPATTEQCALRDQLLQDVKNLRDNKKSKIKIASFTTLKREEVSEEAANLLRTSSNSGASSSLVEQNGVSEFIIEDEIANISDMNEVELAATTIAPTEVVEVAVRGISNTSQGILQCNSSASKTITAVPLVPNRTRPCNPKAAPPNSKALQPETRLPPKPNRTRTVSSSSDSSGSSYVGGPMLVKNNVKVNQYLKEKTQIDLINAKAKLLKQENEKKRIELEEKRMETMLSAQNRLISIVEQLVKQRSRPDVKDQSLSNHSSTFVLHPPLP